MSINRGDCTWGHFTLFFHSVRPSIHLRAEILQLKEATEADTFVQERAPGTSVKLQNSHLRGPTMNRVSPVSVEFCCASANGECCSQPSRYRMRSAMAELSTVRASGFRQSVQFDFSVKPGGSAVTMLLEPCGECMALVSLPSQSQEATHF